MSQDPSWNAKIRESLALLDGLDARMGFLRDGPRAGSQAATDAALRNGSLGWSLAAAALQVSFDHLRAWRHLHAAGMQPPFAHWTLLRSAVEAAATVRWLCAVGRGTGRGVGAELYDLSQRQGFEARVGARMSWVPPPKVTARDRTQRLIAETESDGMSREALPGSTALAASLPPAQLGKETVDSEVLYRAMSGIAHAKMWPMPILGDVVRGDKVALAPEVAVTSVTAPADIVWLLTDWAVKCLDLALIDFERYTVG